jgi:beta-lactamase regulating signal transducer with metallopeptidase domain
MSIINVLGESAVRSLALALAVAIVLRVLRVQHARLAKRAWTAVLLLSLAMPALVALHIPSFSFTALWSTPRTVVVGATPPAVSAANMISFDPADNSVAIAQAPAQPSAQLEDLAPAITLSVPVPAELQGAPQGPPQGAPAPARHIAWWQIGFAAYLAITALLLLRVCLGLALAARLWRRAQPFAISETDLPGSHSGRLSVRLSVDLRSPATVGHGILLPLEAIGWDDAALSATLAHEAKHIREGDFYLQLAATLHHCFFWISPHAWWLRPQLSRLSETICDRAAIASSGDGLSYAELLVRFATAEQTPAGMVAMAQSAGLRERIERLIADPQLTGAFRHRRGQAIVAAALFAAAAVVTAATVHFVQPATIVLAAPQAPAPPAAPAALPALSDPQAAPVTAPDAAPPPFPALPPDAVPASGVGIGIGEGAGLSQSQDTFVNVQPGVNLNDNLSTDVHTQVFAAPTLDGAPPVMAVGPMGAVGPMVPLGPMTGSMAMIQPRVGVGAHMKIMAMPHVLTLQSGDNDVIMLNGRNYAICGPGSHGVVHDCALNGYSLKDHQGAAVLFERDGKTYVIDDPALVKQAQDAFARVEELGKQQGALGAKQGELGAKQGELGALQGELGAMQGQLGSMEGHFDGSNFRFEMPANFDQEVQSFTDSTTRLALEQKLSDADRTRLEAEQKEARANLDKALADWKAQQPQREAMEKQIRDQAEQIRKQMEPLIEKMHALGAKQGDLGHLQGELGRQQGLLGIQQRDASREADSKMQSLIDRAMKDGKAHPVQ